MKFTLEIKSENAAFEDSPRDEVARILREVADKIEGGNESGYALDYNGNKVGSYDLDLPEPDDEEDETEEGEA